MKSNTTQAKQLQYMTHFNCIGGACEDNCCIGWDVDIDLKTFQKYQKVKDPELKALYQSKIKPYPYLFSEEVDYARVQLAKDKRCPFLNEKGLCKTQAKLGEDYLSNVCATFPRMTNWIDGVLETTLTLSCPEAARLVLLNPEGLYWEDAQIPKRKIINMTIETSDPAYKKHPVRYFQSIRQLSVEILRDRKYQIWERLHHLGQLFEALDEVSRQKQTQKIPAVLSTYEKIHSEALWKIQVFATSDEAAAAQLHRVEEIILRMNILTDIDSKGYKAHTRVFQKAFSPDSKIKKSKSEDYLSLLRHYQSAFLEPYAYILENYLVNFVYKNLFPFTESEVLFEAYTMLALRFVMIRAYLLPLVAQNSAPDPMIAVNHIQLFAKAIEHHKHFSEETLKRLKSDQLIHMSYMEMLLYEPRA